MVNCSPIQPNAAEPILSQETWSTSGNHNEDQIEGLFTMADVNRNLPLDRNEFVRVRVLNVAEHQPKLWEKLLVCLLRDDRHISSCVNLDWFSIWRVQVKNLDADPRFPTWYMCSSSSHSLSPEAATVCAQVVLDLGLPPCEGGGFCRAFERQTRAR